MITVLFEDHQVIIASSEDNLQKAIYQLYKLLCT
jgi:hypothetical protein